MAMQSAKIDTEKEVFSLFLDYQQNSREVNQVYVPFSKTALFKTLQNTELTYETEMSHLAGNNSLVAKAYPCCSSFPFLSVLELK